MSPAPAHEPPELMDESTATEGEELAMLEARMMQWCFLNARATHAFEKQMEIAQVHVCVFFGFGVQVQSLGWLSVLKRV